ncbi:MAG: hypothetical protein PHO64_11805 [Thiomonas sp.]|nr:hypothetical protein [Thiomonas sp.]
MTRAADRLHERIAQECRAIQTPAAPGGNDPRDYPHALRLLEAAIAALEASIPAQFEFEGRTYRLRARFKRIELGLHADPASASPLILLETEGLRWCGFQPGH